MIKKILITLAVCASLIVLGLFMLAGASRHVPALGLTAEGTLTACPNRPNCISSEEGDAKPLAFAGSPDVAWKNLRLSIQSLGGTVQTVEGNYLASTFESAFFGFVDDVEFRMVPEQQILHFRSASRVGYSDGGANKKRIEKLRALFFLNDEDLNQ